MRMEGDRVNDIDLGGSLANYSHAAPLRVVGKVWHMKKFVVPYGVTCEVNTVMCSKGSWEV